MFIVVPLTYLLPYALGMGTDGVFMAEPVSNVLGGCACFFAMLATVLPELKQMEKVNAEPRTELRLKSKAAPYSKARPSYIKAYRKTGTHSVPVFVLVGPFSLVRPTNLSQSVKDSTPSMLIIRQG